MPVQRLTFDQFNGRVSLIGGREQSGTATGGNNYLRRGSGVAPELTTSVISRWGSQFLYPIEAIQVYYWNGNRYQYDGTALYQNGVSINSTLTAAGIIPGGFNGTRLTFNSMPPQSGLQDYLFILGGGAEPFKISPMGTPSFWGIVAPSDAAQANNAFQSDLIVIDTFNDSALGNGWQEIENVTLANENSEYAVVNANDTGGSLKINPSAGPWRIGKYYTHGTGPLNLEYYSTGDFSLETDVIQFWFFFNQFGGTSSGNSSLSTWLQLDFDVIDGTFKRDFYTVVFDMIPSGSTNPAVKKNPSFSVRFQTAQWQQVTIPKSLFTRTGLDLQYDWGGVYAIRFSGGNFTGALYLDYFTLMGGCAMGAGPAVGNGGSEYDYYVVYRNLTTGSQSNPQAAASKVFDVQVNKVQLSSIPLSTDPQVTARDLYRTQALTQPGGGTPFYLDTIYDNTTTTYLDYTADSSERLVTTPWQAQVAVPPQIWAFGANYFIDAGNGYYFKLTTPGTTAAQPPTWTIPSTTWSPQTAYVVGETTSEIKAAGNFWEVTSTTGNGQSGLIEPNWAQAGPITDGNVIWTNIGNMSTTETTGVVWTFQGINSTRVLGNDQVLLDNAPPLKSYGDAIGPYQGSMLWTRDSTPGYAGYVYCSPPGRPESVGQAYLVSNGDDPMQKVTVWDQVIWALSEGRAFFSSGSYPALTFYPVDDSLGTLKPYTVIPLKEMGICYYAPDGIRLLNYVGSRLFGFRQLATILRGQSVEDVPSFVPMFAEEARNEIWFSDGLTLTVALTFDSDGMGFGWRLPGQILTAMYYEHQTGQIQAAFGGNTYLFEQEFQLLDGTNPIPFELQVAGAFPDPMSQFTTQRIEITANLNLSSGALTSPPQQLTPTIILDGVSYTLPKIVAIPNKQRVTYELTPKLPARFFDGLRLTGSLTGRIELYRVELDVWYGEQQMPAAAGR